MNSTNIVPLARAPGAAVSSFDDMLRLADAIAKSQLFGIKTPDQALVLMAISQAEGRHPALAARDYDIIQGRPSKKSEAMLRDFIESGGKVEWHTLADTEAEATFSHPAGGTVRIRWDTDRLRIAGLLGKDMHKKYPRQMLRARVVSEGVRTVCPMATSGMYVPEEMTEFEPPKVAMRDVTPPRETAPAQIAPQPVAPPVNPETGEFTPHKIAVPMADTGLPNWIGFGAKIVAAYKAASSISELAEWEFMNIEALNEMAVKSGKAHGRVMMQLHENRARLAPPEPEMLGADETDRVLAGK